MLQHDFASMHIRRMDTFLGREWPQAGTDLPRCGHQIPFTGCASSQKGFPHNRLKRMNPSGLNAAKTLNGWQRSRGFRGRPYMGYRWHVENPPYSTSVTLAFISSWGSLPQMKGKDEDIAPSWHGIKTRKNTKFWPNSVTRHGQVTHRRAISILLHFGAT